MPEIPGIVDGLNSLTTVGWQRLMSSDAPSNALYSAPSTSIFTKSIFLSRGMRSSIFTLGTVIELITAVASSGAAEVIALLYEPCSTSSPSARPAATWRTSTLSNEFARRLASMSFALSGFGSIAVTLPVAVTSDAESIV